jgi:hypothetical protein
LRNAKNMQDSDLLTTRGQKRIAQASTV